MVGNSDQIITKRVNLLLLDHLLTPISCQVVSSRFLGSHRWRPLSPQRESREDELCQVFTLSTPARLRFLYLHHTRIQSTGMQKQLNSRRKSNMSMVYSLKRKPDGARSKAHAVLFLPNLHQFCLAGSKTSNFVFQISLALRDGTDVCCPHSSRFFP